MIKKILHILREFDFIWSIPSAFLMFISFPILGGIIWGESFSGYDPSFFHAGIYALMLGVLFNGATQMGIFFNFPELYDYYLSDFSKIEPLWLKALIFLFVYAFFFVSFLLIWKVIV